MIEVKKILCVIDFTSPSKKALETANDLARKYSAELLMVNLIGSASLDRGFFETETPECLKSASQSSHTVGDYLREEAKDKGITEINEPADAILQIAERENIDLIILGSPEVKDLRRYFFGLVANKVNTLSNTMVLNIDGRNNYALSEELIAPPMEQGG